MDPDWDSLPDEVWPNDIVALWVRNQKEFFDFAEGGGNHVTFDLLLQLFDAYALSSYPPGAKIIKFKKVTR